MAEHGGEFIVPFGSHCWVQKGSNGETKCIVGPKKVSPEAADECVILVKDPQTGKQSFIQVNRETAIQPNVVIPKGYYAFLFNPAVNGNQPDTRGGGGEYSATALDTGNKIIKIGPDSFPLWPGQWVELVKGHTMQPDEYLVTLIYDADAAMKNMSQEIVTTQAPEDSDIEPEEEQKEETEDLNLQEGDRKVIRGDRVKFYIPPTGIRVLPREDGKGFVETACRVGAMEYGHLRKKDGTERYERGPQMIFPDHDEVFVRYEYAAGDNRIFPVFELTDLSGIHIKINYDYEDAFLGECKEGQEYFITGKTYPIYVPRPEHEIIRYGKGRIIHHAVLIPEGMARYKAHRLNGSITKVNGPINELLDPRIWKWVIRALNPKTSQLWYPNSQEAFNHNQTLYAASASGGQVDQELLETYALSNNSDGLQLSSVAFGGQRDRAFKAKKTRSTRTQEMTALPKPEIVDILSQTSAYDCAPEIHPWTGYAVMIQTYNESTNQIEAKVVLGPAKVIMDFTDELAMIQLSTGTPKNHDNTIETVYLQHLNNAVSDMVEVETNDFVTVQLHYRLRVKFEGETQDEMKKWFSHTNYIQLITTEIRSMLKSMAKKTPVQDLYMNASDMIRDLILGTKVEGEHRPGRLFDENNCHVYDVDVLSCAIVDDAISQMLHQAQQLRVRQIIELKTSEDGLDHMSELEDIKRKGALVLQRTSLHKMKLQEELNAGMRETVIDEIAHNAEVAMTKIKDDLKLAAVKQKAQKEALAIQREVFEANLQESKDESDHYHKVAEETAKLQLESLEAEAAAFERAAAAVSTHLTAALTTFSQNELTGKLTDALNPLAILDGKSIADVAQSILGDTEAGDAVRKLLVRPTKK